MSVTSSLDRFLDPIRRSSHSRRRLSRKQQKVPPPPLEELLNARDFQAISDALIDPNVDTNVWFDEEYSTIGENCLHITMKARPPSSLVKLMMQCLAQYGISEPELSIDELGRTPLHQAVGYSCSPAVIATLVSSPAGKTSVRAQDVEGRIPLHLALRPYLLYTGKNNQIHTTANISISHVQKYMQETVSILIGVCPRSALVADDSGKIPAKYAEHLAADKNFRQCARNILATLNSVEQHASSPSSSKKKKTCSAAATAPDSPSKRNGGHSGMVIEIGSITSSTFDDDDLSVISWG